MQVNPDSPAGEAGLIVDAVVSSSRVLVAIAARSLADAGEEVTLTQYRSLVVLASRGSQSVASLADALAVTAPTASRLCERLVRKGLATRQTEASDRRQVNISLSSSGRQLIAIVTERRRHEVAHLIESIPPEVQRAMADGLHLMSLAAGEVPEQEWSTGWDL